jgi:hypothetical protein
MPPYDFMLRYLINPRGNFSLVCTRYHHHHKHPGLGHLARSVTRVNVALYIVSLVYMNFNLPVGIFVFQYLFCAFIILWYLNISNKLETLRCRVVLPLNKATHTRTETLTASRRPTNTLAANNATPTGALAADSEIRRKSRCKQRDTHMNSRCKQRDTHRSSRWTQ